MDPKETIKKNLKRRSEFVDIVPIHEGIPYAYLGRVKLN